MFQRCNARFRSALVKAPRVKMPRASTSKPWPDFAQPPAQPQSDQKQRLRGILAVRIDGEVRKKGCDQSQTNGAKEPANDRARKGVVKRPPRPALNILCPSCTVAIAAPVGYPNRNAEIDPP